MTNKRRKYKYRHDRVLEKMMKDEVDMAFEVL